MNTIEQYVACLIEPYFTNPLKREYVAKYILHNIGVNVNEENVKRYIGELILRGIDAENII